MRQNIVALLVVMMVLGVLLGCSPKLEPDDIAKDPNHAIAAGIKKTVAYRNNASASPLDMICRATTNGNIKITLATNEGNKALYEVSQDRENSTFFTSYKNSGADQYWQCALTDDAVFKFKPARDAEWYGLQLYKNHTGYASTHLAEALNWNDYDIWSKIEKEYGRFVDEVLNDSYENVSDFENMTNALTDITKSLAPEAIEAGTVDIRGQGRASIQIIYDLDNASSLRLFDAMMNFYGGEDTGYDAYLTNICRRALSDAGCDFYEVKPLHDQFAYRLFLTRYNVEKYYDTEERDTSLVVFLDAETEVLLSFATLSSGNLGGGSVTLQSSWAIDPTAPNGLREDFSFSMDAVNTNVEGFEYTLTRDITNTATYSDKSVYTFKTLAEIARHSNEFIQDRSNGEYTMTVCAAGRNLTLRGVLVNKGAEAVLSIREVENNADNSITPVDMEITTVSGGKVPTVDSEYKNFEGMSEEETRAAHGSFIASMPKSVFGDWTPVSEMDPKLYDEFDSTYDYNKDGIVDGADKSYYEHLHLILTAPVE